MRIETLAVHAGYSPDPTTKAVAVPIYQTVAYAFDSAQPAESGAGIHTGQRRHEPGHTQKSHQRDQVGSRGQHHVGGEGRHDGRGQPNRDEDQIGCVAEQGRCRFRHQRLFAQQAQKVAIGLKDGCARSSLKSRLGQPRDAGDQRRHGDDQDRVQDAPQERRQDHCCLTATTNNRITKVANIIRRYWRMVRNCVRLKKSAMRSVTWTTRR